MSLVIVLLMDLFRGAVSAMAGVPENSPLSTRLKCQPAPWPWGGPFPLLNEPFSGALMGRFPDFVPLRPFYLLKIHWKTAH